LLERREMVDLPSAAKESTRRIDVRPSLNLPESHNRQSHSDLRSWKDPRKSSRMTDSSSNRFVDAAPRIGYSVSSLTNFSDMCSLNLSCTSGFLKLRFHPTVNINQQQERSNELTSCSHPLFPVMETAASPSRSVVAGTKPCGTHSS
jgi:hypothetical protein